MWRYDIKYEYMFSLKNIACKGLLRPNHKSQQSDFVHRENSWRAAKYGNFARLVMDPFISGCMSYVYFSTFMIKIACNIYLLQLIRCLIKANYKYEILQDLFDFLQSSWYITGKVVLYVITLAILRGVSQWFYKLPSLVLASVQDSPSVGS